MMHHHFKTDFVKGINLMFKLIAMETKLHNQNSPHKTQRPPGSQLH